MINRFISGKFRHPTGFFGRLVGRAISRGHEPAIRWTISLLDSQPDDHILEIGFGPGVGIEYAAQKAAKGLVVGVDASETMVQVARKRNAGAIAAGTVDLKHGEVSSLPYEDASFNKAMTIHCILFLGGRDRLLTRNSPHLETKRAISYYNLAQRYVD